MEPVCAMGAVVADDLIPPVSGVGFPHVGGSVEQPLKAVVLGHTFTPPKGRVFTLCVLAILNEVTRFNRNRCSVDGEKVAYIFGQPAETNVLFFGFGLQQLQYVRQGLALFVVEACANLSFAQDAVYVCK